MSLSRTDLYVVLIAGVTSAILGILASIFGGVTAGILATALPFIIGLFIDLRLHQETLRRNEETSRKSQAEQEEKQHERDAGMQREREHDREYFSRIEEVVKEALERLQLPLVENYARLRVDPCPLFRKFATDKYNEADALLTGLLSGRVELTDLRQVFEFLESMFCELEIVEIHATSCGELAEWCDHESWWLKNFSRIHELAIKRSIRCQRIFILKTEEERSSGQDVYEWQSAQKVVVRLAFQKALSGEDLSLLRNGLLFLDRQKEPIYCLLASHNDAGEFEKATIYRDPLHLKKVSEAYKRIERAAKVFHSHGTVNSPKDEPLPKKG